MATTEPVILWVDDTQESQRAIELFQYPSIVPEIIASEAPYLPMAEINGEPFPRYDGIWMRLVTDYPELSKDDAAIRI